MNINKDLKHIKNENTAKINVFENNNGVQDQVFQ